MYQKLKKKISNNGNKISKKIERKEKEYMKTRKKNYF